MAKSRKKRMKKAALNCLCIAALASGANVPGVIPPIIPPVTAAAAEDAIPSDHVIDLSLAVDYHNRNAELPYGVNTFAENNSIWLQIENSGTYKLIGENLINGAYFDVKIIAAEGTSVNLICDNAAIKNTDAIFSSGNYFGTIYSEHAFDERCSLVNYTVPFRAEKDAVINFSGRLSVDTAALYIPNDNVYYDYRWIVPVAEGDGTVNTENFSTLSINDGAGTIDTNYYLSASAEAPYTADIASDGIVHTRAAKISDLFTCVPSMPIDVKGNTDVMVYNAHHSDENGTCDQCGLSSAIDLGLLLEYQNGSAAILGAACTNTGSLIKITINQSGTYKLTGSNFINNSFVDMQIAVADGCNVVFECDDAYIKNEFGKFRSGDFFANKIFDFGYNTNVSFTGRMILDVADVIGSPVGLRNIISSVANDNAFAKHNLDSFNKLTVTDENGAVCDAVYFLNASADNSYTYNLKGMTEYVQAITDQLIQYHKKLSDTYSCLSGSGEITITGDTTVKVYTNHSIGADFVCETCGLSKMIDLGSILDYISGDAESPLGVTVKYAEANGKTFTNIVEVVINESGDYKITGSNFIDGEYVDVKIIAAEDVNVHFDCDNASIKNDNGLLENKEADGNEVHYAKQEIKDYYSSFSIYDFAVPFESRAGATMDFDGNLAVDALSIFDVNKNSFSFRAGLSTGEGTFDTTLFDTVTIREADNYGTVYSGNIVDVNYYLKPSTDNTYTFTVGSDTTYAANSGCLLSVNAFDYCGGCYSAENSDGKNVTITGETAISYMGHSFPADSYVCDNCGDERAIDLGKLIDYMNGVENVDGVYVTKSRDGYLNISINESGTYKLTGSNFINGSYVDVQVSIDRDGIILDCDNAVIKNINATFNCGNIASTAPFKIYNSKVTFKGTLVAEGASFIDIQGDNMAASRCAKIIDGWNYSANTDDFRILTLEGEDGKVLDTVYFLGASDENSYTYDVDSMAKSAYKVTDDGQGVTKKELANRKIVDLFDCVSERGEIAVTDDKTIKVYKTHEMGDGLLCVHCEDELCKITAHNITLAEDINVNIYADISTAVNSEDAYAEFTVCGRTIKQSFSEAEKTVLDDKEVYKFTCPVSAAEMADVIKVKFVAGETESAEHTYSVTSYAEYIFNHAEDYAESVDVVKAMLNYGAAAQKYFGHNTENPANAALSVADKKLPTLTAAAFADSKYNVTGTSKDYVFKGMTLLLQDKTVIKLLFDKDGEQVVEQIPLNAGEIGIGKTYSFYDYTFTNLSAYSYIEQALTDKSLSSDADLISLLSALYAYSEETKTLN